MRKIEIIVNELKQDNYLKRHIIKIDAKSNFALMHLLDEDTQEYVKITLLDTGILGVDGSATFCFLQNINDRIIRYSKKADEQIKKEKEDIKAKAEKRQQIANLMEELEVEECNQLINDYMSNQNSTFQAKK